MSKTPQPQSNPNTTPNFVVENPEFDKVVVLPTPKPINAGETIGLMGEYNVEGEENIKCLHLEVFANEDFKFFLQNARRGDGNLPQSFNWAIILDSENSIDHVSIFQNMRALYDHSEDLKMSEMYMSLFNMIDKDMNGSLEVQELKNAAKDENIKNVTNKYIVKHSSEWDKTENMAQKLIEIVESISADKLINKDEVLKDLKLEKERITKLSFFEECKNIEGFPNSDMVYVINPIGLVNEFSKGCQITKEMLLAMGCTIASNNQPLIDALNKYCQLYEINTCLRVAHFLAQAAHESAGFTSFKEGIHFTLDNAISTWSTRETDIRALPMDGKYIKQPNLYNSVYGTRNGNVIGTNDGFDFRGRGAIQITGRTNYTNYQTSHNAKNSDDIKDFVNNSAHREEIKTNVNYAVESACWYWTTQGKGGYSNINTLADMGTTDEILLKVSASVNGWYDSNRDGIPNKAKGYDEPNKPFSRLPLFHKVKNHMGL